MKPAVDYRSKVRRPAWVEIRLDRLVRNVRRFQAIIGESDLAAVVKADAYDGKCAGDLQIYKPGH